MPSTKRKRTSTKRRSGPKAIRTIRTPSGVRYMRGGKFIKASAVKASRKAKRRHSAKAATSEIKAVRRARAAALKRPKRRKAVHSGIVLSENPRRKRRRKTATKGSKMAVKKRRRRTTKKTKVVRKSRSRKAAARKAARTRALKKAKRSAAAKKAARTRKRRVRSNPRRRVAAKSVRRTRRRVRRNPPRGAKGRFVRRGKSRRHRGAPLFLRSRPGGGLRKYRVKRSTRRSEKGKRFYRYGVARVNPLNLLKRTLPIYGGMLGVRVLAGLVKQFTATTTSIPASIAPFIPTGAAFLFSALIAPKIKAIKGNLLQGMQLGSTILLLDQVVKAAVNMVPPEQKTGTVGTVLNSLAGYDDMGIASYGGYGGYGGYAGLSEYTSDPSGYSLPAVRSMPISGYGTEAAEAMALDEYVPEQLGNYQVEEALSNAELTYMQNGGAGGSLRGSLFRS